MTTSRRRSTAVPARRADPFAVGALVSAGTFLGHQVGYLLDRRAGAAHDYLSVVGPVVVIAGVVAAWLVAVRIVRADTGRAPRLRTLIGLQTVSFLLMESMERVALGDGLGSLRSPAVVAGLIAQPLVAWLALRLLDGAAEVIRRFQEQTAAAIPPPAVSARPPHLRFVPVRVSPAHRHRGPPLG